MSDTKALDEVIDFYHSMNDTDEDPDAVAVADKAAAELAKLKNRLDVACHIKATDKVGFDWEILDTIAQLRAELDEAIRISRAFYNKFGKIIVSAEYRGVFVLAQIHGCQYTGEQCNEEFDALGNFLSAHPEETK